MTSVIQTGDRVTLIGVPAGLRDTHVLATKSLFEACLGQSFVVSDSTTEGLAELHVGHVFGEAPYMQTIWVESQYLAPV